MNLKRSVLFLLASCLVVAACDDSEDSDSGEKRVYEVANTCVSVTDGSRWLKASGDGQSYDWSATTGDDAAHFYLKASDLGMYLFYDQERGYLVGANGTLARRTELEDGLMLFDDSFKSPAEWKLDASGSGFVLKNRQTDEYLGSDGLAAEANAAMVVRLEPADGCAEFPEMSEDATGEVVKTRFEDGTLFGFADTHSHILSNFGFGGGGIFYGSPFHRLGVEHALGDCTAYHGEEGMKDFLDFGFKANSADALGIGTLISLLTDKQLPEPNHHTDGWPTFSGWPGPTSSTHQTQYYKWLERAWKSGMRLMVQHAVSNEALCDLLVNAGIQYSRWSCRDMLNIDRQFMEIRRMEDYIDAQNGGPGKGWFHVVESPAEAREVIARGELAIVLGMEVPNLFSCYLTPGEGDPECDTEYIESQLDHYYEMGARALFPNHKYSNRFAPADGDRGIFELGDFITTGHFSNYVHGDDCPDQVTVFDNGPVQFSGLNRPRDEYISEPPYDEYLPEDAPREPITVQSPETAVLDLAPLAGLLGGGFTETGDYCQKTGLTDAGETLIRGMMKRGMIIEIDHSSTRTYRDIFNMLEEYDYPASGSHGNTNNGKLFEVGGVSKSGFNRCANPEVDGAMANSFRAMRDQMVAAGMFPAVGFGFDLNGFAGVPGPRFGPLGCDNQQDESTQIQYPFMSYAGDVEFTQPYMGERKVDFDTEGMIHIGLVPELIQDARNTGVSDEDLDILFRSAEGYIRMWEHAEERAGALSFDQ